MHNIKVLITKEEIPNIPCYYNKFEKVYIYPTDTTFKYNDYCDNWKYLIKNKIDFVYAFTSISGEHGGQISSFYKNGKLKYHTEQFRAINKALRKFGIKSKHPKWDEFAKIGLNKFRCNYTLNDMFNYNV